MVISAKEFLKVFLDFVYFDPKSKVPKRNCCENNFFTTSRVFTGHLLEEVEYHIDESDGKQENCFTYCKSDLLLSQISSIAEYDQ